MTPPVAAAFGGVGLVLLVGGLFILFGAWALVGSGVAIVAFALLTPVKERRAEPAGEDSPPL